jgi:hypothetical protein
MRLCYRGPQRQVRYVHNFLYMQAFTHIDIGALIAVVRLWYWVDFD